MAAVLIVLAGAVGSAEAAEPRPRVTSVVLRHASGDAERTVLVLRTKHADSDNEVDAFRRIVELETIARARELRSDRWRIAPENAGNRRFLASIRQDLEARGIARLWAGVGAVGGGRLSQHVLEGYNNPAPALGH